MTMKITLILVLFVLGRTFAAPEKTRSEIFDEAQKRIDDGLGKPLSDYNFDITRNADGSLTCPQPMLLEGVTEEMIKEAGKGNHFNPVEFYALKSFLHGFETRFANVNADGKPDCRSFLVCGWRQHVNNDNHPEVIRCQKNAVFQPTRIIHKKKCDHCDKDGFGGLAFAEKTGMCVYSPDIKGYFMDHCRSEAGEYVDPLTDESEQFIINDDESKNQGENFEIIEHEKPEEKEDFIADYLDSVDDEESGDIVSNIYGDFELPEYSNDEPSEPISPKFNWQEQGWDVEQFIIDDESKDPRESIDMIEEENEDSIVDFKVETAEISDPELEAVEKTIEPELKVEDETFDETEEVGRFKTEQIKRTDQSEHDVYGSRIQSSLNGDYWRQPKQITVVDNFSEEVHDTKVETAENNEPELEAFEKNIEPEFKAEQVEQAEYEADLEAELKSYGNLEEKIW